MKSFFAFCFAAFLFQGCFNKDKYYSLDDNQKIIYSQGDTLVYNSNHDNVAQYRIIKI